MAVDTDTQQWATREELRALEKQVSKLEGQFSESDKRLATKEDVKDVLVELAGVKKDIVWIKLLLVLVLSGVVMTVFRLYAGGVP